MNELVATLVEQAKKSVPHGLSPDKWIETYNEKFAELIVEECRNVVTDVYHKTPLELCGPLLTADEEIANHFYGVEE